MTIMPVIFPPGPYPSTGGLVPDGSGDINIAAQFTENSGTPEGDYWIIPGGLDPLNPLVACLAANPDPGITVLVSYSFDVEFDRALGANEAVVVGVGAGVGAPGGPPPAWNQALYGWSIDATGVGYLSALESGTGPNVYGSSSSPANPSSYPLGAPVTISGSTYLPLDYLTSNSGSLLNSIFFFVNTQKLDTLTNGALTTVISNVVVTADVVLPPGHTCAIATDSTWAVVSTPSGVNALDPGTSETVDLGFTNSGPDPDTGVITLTHSGFGGGTAELISISFSGSPLTYTINGLPPGFPTPIPQGGSITIEVLDPLPVGETITATVQGAYPPGEAYGSTIEVQGSALTTSGNPSGVDGLAWYVGALDVPACGGSYPTGTPALGTWVDWVGVGAVDGNATPAGVALVGGAMTWTPTGSSGGAIFSVDVPASPDCPADTLREITLKLTPIGLVSGSLNFFVGAQTGGTPSPAAIVSGSDANTIPASSVGTLIDAYTVPTDTWDGEPITIILQTTGDGFTLGLDDTGPGGSGITQWDVSWTATQCVTCAVTVCPDITATAIATPSSQIVDSCQIVDVVVDITTSGDPAQLLLVPVIPPGSTIVAPTYLTYINASGPSTLVSTAGALVDVLSGGTIQALIRIATHCAGVGVGSLDVVEPCSATVLASGTFELTHN